VKTADNKTNSWRSTDAPADGNPGKSWGKLTTLPLLK